MAAGAWVGGDNRSIRFKHWALGQGARTAMPIYKRFMLKVYDDKSLPYEKGQFDRPITPVSVELDCSVYNSEIPADSLILNTVEEDDFF